MRNVWPLLLVPCAAFAQGTETFDSRCEKLASKASLSIVFQDRTPGIDRSRGAAELKGMSGSSASPFHTTLGLTRAQPTARVEASTQMLADTDGRVCVFPSLRVTFGFSELQIYLAKELTNPCRREVVEQHEIEHAGVWRNYFRAGARLSEPLLKRTLLVPLHAGNATEAHARLKQNIDAAVGDVFQRLRTEALAANLQIDTPRSYQQGEARMRACPR